MDKLEIKKQAVDLAKAYIQNSNVVLVKAEHKAEETKMGDEIYFNINGKLIIPFKQIVKYFERQLEQIYNES